MCGVHCRVRIRHPDVYLIEVWVEGGVDEPIRVHVLLAELDSHGEHHLDPLLGQLAQAPLPADLLLEVVRLEQLRLELQMSTRVLASTREQLVKCGGLVMPENASVRVPPTQYTSVRPGRSKSDAKLMQRMQDEVAEGRGLCRHLGEQVDDLETRLGVVVTAKKEMLGVLDEMQDYLVKERS